MTNKLGFNPKENELKVYENKLVRIMTGSSDYSLGIVDNYSPEYISLKPSLVNHGLYDYEGNRINQVIIERELPQKIKLASINKIEPIKEGYLESFARNLNEKSNPSKIILVKR